jgi:hypothetical protein
LAERPEYIPTARQKIQSFASGELLSDELHEAGESSPWQAGDGHNPEREGEQRGQADEELRHG